MINKDLEKIATINSMKIKTNERNEIIHLQELILLNSILENVSLTKIEARVVQYKIKHLLNSYIRLDSNKEFFNLAKDD